MDPIRWKNLPKTLLLKLPQAWLLTNILPQFSVMSTTTNRMLVVFLLAMVNFTNILDFMIMMPMSDMLTKQLHINAQEFGILVSSYGLAAFTAGIIGVSVFDRFDRKKLLLFAFTFFLLATFGCSMVDSYYSLLGMRVLAGLFGGVIGSIVVSMVADLFDFHERGKAMGLLMMGFAGASILGVPLGLYLAGTSNWQYPFFMIASLGCVLLIALIFILPPFVKHLQGEVVRKSFGQILVRSFSNANQRNALLLSFVLILGHFIIIPFIAMYMIRNVGVPEDQIFLIYLVGGIISVITGPMVGKLTDRIGAKKVFTFFVFAATIPVALITNLPPVESWVAFACTGLFFLFVSGRMIPVTTLISSVVTPQERGSFESLRASIIQLGSALSAIIGGLIVNEKGLKVENYSLAGLVSILLCVSCLYFSNKIKINK
jgi:MFS transporter, DHA1 family, inner membrane transport protein